MIAAARRALQSGPCLRFPACRTECGDNAAREPASPMHPHAPASDLPVCIGNHLLHFLCELVKFAGLAFIPGKAPAAEVITG